MRAAKATLWDYRVLDTEADEYLDAVAARDFSDPQPRINHRRWVAPPMYHEWETAHNPLAPRWEFTPENGWVCHEFGSEPIGKWCCNWQWPVAATECPKCHRDMRSAKVVHDPWIALVHGR